MTPLWPVGVVTSEQGQGPPRGPECPWPPLMDTAECLPEVDPLSLEVHPVIILIDSFCRGGAYYSGGCTNRGGAVTEESFAVI